MKKLFCISLIAVTFCIVLPFGMTGMSATPVQNSVPLSSQEMSSSVGGVMCVNVNWFVVCYIPGASIWWIE
jgi:hypothetical protein